MGSTRVVSGAGAAALMLEAERKLCTSNFRDDACGNLAAPLLGLQVMVKLEIDDGRQEGRHIKEADDEGSTSFRDSEDTEDGAGSSGQCIEVESPFSVGVGSFNVVEALFKRQKVTEDWRIYSSPLVWRCQWLELRMKELLSQASKYEKELCLLKREKTEQSELVKGDNLLAAKEAVNGQYHATNNMKRRRKRLEDVTDASLYMKKHPLFSYYENKGLEFDDHLVDENGGLVRDNVKSNLETWWLVDTKEDDFVIQQLALENILQIIDATQSRLASLRMSLRVTISEEELDPYTSELVNHNQSPLHPQSRGDEISSDGTDTPSTVSYCPLGDISLEEVSTEDLSSRNIYAVGTSMTGRTAGILMGSDDPAIQRRIVGFYQSGEDILIDNQKAEEGYEHIVGVRSFKEPLHEQVKKQSLCSDRVRSDPQDVVQEVIAGGERFGVAKTATLIPLTTKKRRGRPRKKQLSLTVASKGRTQNLSPMHISLWQSKDVDIARATAMPLSTGRRKSRRVPTAKPPEEDDASVPSSMLTVRRQAKGVSSTDTCSDRMSADGFLIPAARQKRTEKVFMVTPSSSRSGRIIKPKVH